MSGELDSVKDENVADSFVIVKSTCLVVDSFISIARAKYAEPDKNFNFAVSSIVLSSSTCSV